MINSIPKPNGFKPNSPQSASKPNPNSNPPSPPQLASEPNSKPNSDLQTSPLSEAEPESLDELFSRIDSKLVLGIPKEITEDDISRVVDYYRDLRVKFVQDQANFVKPGRASSGKPTKKSIAEALKNATLEF